MNWETMPDLLRLAPVQRAIVALLIAGIGFPVVGVFVVGLNIMPVRFAMMHVALLGIAVGLLVGLDPTATGLLFCAATGAAIAPLAGRPAGLSGPMGLLMTLAIAGSLLVLSLSGVNANGAFALLWGSILATRKQDVVLIAVIAAAALGLFLWRRRELAVLLYDREIAICSGIAVGWITVVLMVVVSVAIAAAVRLTGALLVDSVTLLPALAARNVGRSLNSMVGWAIFFGVSCNMLGFALTLLFDQPPGPVLVVTAGAVTLATFFIGGNSK